MRLSKRAGSYLTLRELVDEVDAVIEKLLAGRKVEAHVTHQLIASPLDDGMITLRQAGLRTVQAGMTSVEEILRIIS